MTWQAEHLHRLATGARDSGDRLRAVAWAVSSTRAVTWESSAAQAFRDAAAARALALRHRAAALDEAGDLVHAHALVVDDALSELARVTRWLGGAGDPPG